MAILLGRGGNGHLIKSTDGHLGTCTCCGPSVTCTCPFTIPTDLTGILTIFIRVTVPSGYGGAYTEITDLAALQATIDFYISTYTTFIVEHTGSDTIDADDYDGNALATVYFRGATSSITLTRTMGGGTDNWANLGTQHFQNVTFTDEWGTGAPSNIFNIYGNYCGCTWNIHKIAIVADDGTDGTDGQDIAIQTIFKDGDTHTNGIINISTDFTAGNGGDAPSDASLNGGGGGNVSCAVQLEDVDCCDINDETVIKSGGGGFGLDAVVDTLESRYGGYAGYVYGTSNGTFYGCKIQCDHVVTTGTGGDGGDGAAGQDTDSVTSNNPISNGANSGQGGSVYQYDVFNTNSFEECHIYWDITINIGPSGAAGDGGLGIGASSTNAARGNTGGSGGIAGGRWETNLYKKVEMYKFLNRLTSCLAFTNLIINNVNATATGGQGASGAPVAGTIVFSYGGKGGDVYDSLDVYLKNSNSTCSDSDLTETILINDKSTANAGSGGDSHGTNSFFGDGSDVATFSRLNTDSTVLTVSDSNIISTIDYNYEVGDAGDGGNCIGTATGRDAGSVNSLRESKLYCIFAAGAAGDLSDLTIETNVDLNCKGDGGNGGTSQSTTNDLSDGGDAGRCYVGVGFKVDQRITGTPTAVSNVLNMTLLTGDGGDAGYDAGNGGNMKVTATNVGLTKNITHTEGVGGSFRTTGGSDGTDGTYTLVLT